MPAAVRRFCASAMASGDRSIPVTSTPLLPRKIALGPNPQPTSMTCMPAEGAALKCSESSK